MLAPSATTVPSGCYPAHGRAANAHRIEEYAGTDPDLREANQTLPSVEYRLHDKEARYQ
jgi:hypothetical protein